MRLASKIFTIATFALAAAAGVAGCGGHSDAPPGPLAQHFDDMYIAAIPLDQQQSVTQAQHDWSFAKRENAKAEADLNEAATQLSVVRNDQKASKLGVESAIANKKAAEASADTNRINQATKELHTAEGLAKAADERVRYFEIYSGYLKTVVRHAQENMYWREAQYELAKAQLGEKNNIAPKGVAYDTFPKQEQDRGRREGASKQKVEAERQRALAARDAWLRAQESADRDNGHPTNLPDPMAAKPEGSTSSSH